MNDRMYFCKNWEVKKEFQNKHREQGGYVVNSDCRAKRGCALCTHAVRISPIKMTKAEYEYARPKGTKWLDRSIARQQYIICPYAECPFKELDGYEVYKAYEADERTKTVDIRGFFRFLTGG